MFRYSLVNIAFCSVRCLMFITVAGSMLSFLRSVSWGQFAWSGFTLVCVDL